jgi:predicted ATP-grasp superfamily ATP-dependent carboligase
MGGSVMQTAMEWAVVVGDGLNALGVVRSLHAGGVRVALLARSPGGESALSRCPRLKRFYGSQADLPEALDALARELGGRPVLLLTEEEAVRVVSANRQRLMVRYRFRMADHATMLDLTHKEGVQRAAERAGLPIPRAVRLQSTADLARLDGLRFPCVLKPAFKHDGYGARFKKAYNVASADEARRLFHEIAPVLPDLVVQEWIVGADDSIFFCLQYVVQGRAVASFTGRKLRSWPPQVGGTASCMPARDAHAELRRLTEDFFRAVGFEGMGSMEYKRDDRDGRYYVVEPTVGRTDFQQEVATINGVNLPLSAYCSECGLPVPDDVIMPDRIWLDATTNRWSAQAQGPHPAFARYPAVDAHFRWNDPAPWLALQWDRVRQRLWHLRPWATGH